MKTYIEQLANYTTLFNSVKNDIYQAVLLDPAFIHDNVTANSGSLIKNATYMKGAVTITVTKFTIKPNDNIELAQTNGQSPTVNLLEIEQLLELYNAFNIYQKEAKEVEFNFVIRVVVDSDKDDAFIATKAYNKLKGLINDKLFVTDWNVSPITIIRDDVDNPYDSTDVGNE